MQPGIKGNELLARLSSNSAILASGLYAEIAGPRSVKISRNGHFHGVWRHAVGSYDWYPAGYNAPQFRAPTAADAANFTAARLTGETHQ